MSIPVLARCQFTPWTVHRFHRNQTTCLGGLRLELHRLATYFLLFSTVISTLDPTHGRQQLSFLSDFYDRRCYLPLAGFLSLNNEPDQYLFFAYCMPVMRWRKRVDWACWNDCCHDCAGRFQKSASEYVSMPALPVQSCVSTLATFTNRDQRNAVRKERPTWCWAPRVSISCLDTRRWCLWEGRITMNHGLFLLSNLFRSHLINAICSCIRRSRWSQKIDWIDFSCRPRNGEAQESAAQMLMYSNLHCAFVRTVLIRTPSGLLRKSIPDRLFDPLAPRLKSKSLFMRWLLVMQNPLYQFKMNQTSLLSQLTGQQ